MTSPHDAVITAQINEALANQPSPSAGSSSLAMPQPGGMQQTVSDSFWHRPGGVAVIGAVGLVAVAIITGTYAIAGSDRPSDPPAVTNCAQQQKDASDLQKANPGVPYTYSGGSEDQCHLNSVTLNIREGQQKSADTNPNS